MFRIQDLFERWHRNRYPVIATSSTANYLCVKKFPHTPLLRLKPVDQCAGNGCLRYRAQMIMMSQIDDLPQKRH